MSDLTKYEKVNEANIMPKPTSDVADQKDSRERKEGSLDVKEIISSLIDQASATKNKETNFNVRSVFPGAPSSEAVGQNGNTDQKEELLNVMGNASCSGERVVSTKEEDLSSTKKSAFSEALLLDETEEEITNSLNGLTFSIKDEEISSILQSGSPGAPSLNAADQKGSNDPQEESSNVKKITNSFNGLTISIKDDEINSNEQFASPGSPASGAAGPKQDLTNVKATTSSSVPHESCTTDLTNIIFRNPDTYKEFIPNFSKPSTSKMPTFENNHNSSGAKAKLPAQLRDHRPHSFLATIDALLFVLEGTLAGAYRIRQNYMGPPVPLVVENTMHSIRLSLDSIKTQLGYTRQEFFEPMSSILRDMLAPAVNFISNICPKLKRPNLEYYSQFLLPESPILPTAPNQTKPPEFLITSREIHGTTVYDSHEVPKPDQPPRVPLFRGVAQGPNLGIYATADGFIRLQFPFTFIIDITLDQAICMRSLRDKVSAAISSCGNMCGIQSSLCRVYQHGLYLDSRITDDYKQKNMYAKVNLRGITFGGTNTPGNLLLKDTGETVTTQASFSDLERDYIAEVFLERSTYGAIYYNDCSDALKDSKSGNLADGSFYFYWKDIRITQYPNGEVTIYRNGRDFSICCSPEVLHEYMGTDKKGIVKLSTPIARMISTVINTRRKQVERYVMANINKSCVYYNYRYFVVNNTTHSTGYCED